MYDNYPNNSFSWLPSDFGLKFALFLVGAAIIIFLVNLFLWKTLKVEKRKFMNPVYVNERHKKVEYRLGLIVGVGAIVVSLANGMNSLTALYTPLAAAFTVTMYRAYMEKKYAENPNEHIYTLLEFVLIVLLVVSLGTFLFPEIPLY